MKLTYIKFIILLGLAVSLLTVVGCDELLNDILSEDIELEEPLFESQTVTGSEESFPVASGKRLSKDSGLDVLSLNDTTAEFAHNPLFSWVNAQGGGRMEADITNGSAYLGGSRISFGHTDSFGDGSDIGVAGPVQPGGSVTYTFDPTNSSLYSPFFAEHFNDALEMLYIFFDTNFETPDAANFMTLDRLEFVTQPSKMIYKDIAANENFADYADAVEDISGMSLTGLITNNGSSDVLMSIMVTPLNESDWDGLEIQAVLPPGTFDLGAHIASLSAAQLAGFQDDMFDALEYMTSGDTRAAMYLTSVSTLDIHVSRILFGGVITVGI